MSTKESPNLFDSIFILLVSSILILFIFFMASRVLQLQIFEELPEWITSVYSSVWTYLMTGSGAILLWFIRKQQSNKQYPNYLLWIAKTTSVLFLLMILSLYTIQIFGKENNKKIETEVADSLSKISAQGVSIVSKFDSSKGKFEKKISQRLVAPSASKKEINNELKISLDTNINGEIYLHTRGSGTTENEALISAEINAFTMILFKGVTGTQQVRPLVDDETASRTQHKKFYHEFIDNRGYKQFVILAIKTGKEINDRVIFITCDIKINLRALRVFLEQSGITRKFGW